MDKQTIFLRFLTDIKFARKDNLKIREQKGDKKAVPKTGTALALFVG
jgi:hypothetical protein